jgi:thiamine biosynthesis protein ThiS
MKVYLEKQDKNIKSKAKNVKDLLNELDINHTTVIVTVNDELVIEDYQLKETDEISILNVVSGG